MHLDGCAGSQGWGSFSITLWGGWRKGPGNKITWGYPTPARDAVETKTAQPLLRQWPLAPVFAPKELGWMWAAASAGWENGSPTPAGWMGLKRGVIREHRLVKPLVSGTDSSNSS